MYETYFEHAELNRIHHKTNQIYIYTSFKMAIPVLFAAFTDARIWSSHAQYFVNNYLIFLLFNL